MLIFGVKNRTGPNLAKSSTLLVCVSVIEDESCEFLSYWGRIDP